VINRPDRAKLVLLNCMACEPASFELSCRLVDPPFHIFLDFEDVLFFRRDVTERLGRSPNDDLGRIQRILGKFLVRLAARSGADSSVPRSRDNSL